MSSYFLYFGIILIANMFGALSGMGGGILIKPLFDLISIHSIAEISFYASAAVLTMAIVSTIKQWRNGMTFQARLAIYISLGSILGGLAGGKLLDFLLASHMEDNKVLHIQIIVTILTLGYAFLYSRFNWQSIHLKSSGWVLAVGFLLGCLASFLGIGGGPINVALLMFCFRLPIKVAAVYSIITIFFSQFSKLAGIAISTGFESFDLSYLAVIIPAAICGGYFGAKLSGIWSEEKVVLVYQWMIIGVIFLNSFNLLTK